MKFLPTVKLSPGHTLRHASLCRGLGLVWATLSFLIAALAPLPCVPPAQAQGNMVVLPDFVAQVKSLRFYATDYGVKSYYERKYATQFPGAKTNHINWELVLDHPFKRTNRVNFAINAILYGPDGKKVAESSNEAWIEPGSPLSQHTETWGRDKPGFWQPGSYRAVIQIDGKDIATGSFQVEGGAAAGGAPPPPPGPTASGVPAFANLHATLAGIKFFPGPNKGVPYGQRQYTDKFDVNTVTFVFWEVGFDYPGARANVAEFPITAIWYNPAGKVMTTQTANAKVQPDWDSSVHSNGYGASNPGAWEPGSYQVVFKVGNQTLGTGNFVIEAAAKKTGGNFLSRINGKVKALRFFESGQELPEFDKRNYTDRFVADQTRYINWELSLDLAGKRSQRVSFPLSAVWYGPDGKVFTTQTRNAYIDPDWPDSWHTSGFGSNKPGTFKQGIYRVVVKIEGQEVAQGSFQVFGAAPPQKDFLAGIGGRVEGVKFYEGADKYIPVEQRQYTESFSAAAAKFIYVDLLLDFSGTRSEEVTFPMEAVWYGPDGQVFTTTKKMGRIAPDWPASVHAMGYGWDNPGHWRPGTYRVVIKIDGKEVGRGTFQMN